MAVRMSEAAAAIQVRSLRIRTVAGSALMLFLELVLIRWTGANVLHLSYFSNFVLLGSFVGIGLGFLRAQPGRRPPYYSPVALALVVFFVARFPVVVDRTDSGVVYFTNLTATGPPIWITLPVLFGAVAVVLAGPGEIVGQCFTGLPRLEAYRLDLVGSLAGIAGFTALSSLRAPSVVWGTVVAVLYILLLGPGPAVLAAAAVVIATLAVESAAPTVSWSPYYKVTTSEAGSSTLISVNGIPHQSVTSAAEREQAQPQYTRPYDRLPGNALRDVLVVGAGTGSDVAIALRRGAGHVDAVEIDPRLAEIGRERNPDHPYQDPRVDVHIDDGRAFLSRTDRAYDLVLFALPDSLTIVSGASSLRLESYLFTEEALRATREHLAPGGGFAMYNYYREPWLIGRLARTLASAYGHQPCVDLLQQAGQQAVLSVALDATDQRCDPATSAAAGPAPVTDSRPFLYLRSASVPRLYLVTLATILLVSLLAVRVVAGPLRRMRPYADLFLLGAGFLLIETKSVTTFALLFGTTWMVNAIVFAGVLLAVLAAVEATRRFRTPPIPAMYGVLGVGLLTAGLVPSSWLLGLPVPARLVAAATIAFLPIFAGNVVFAKRFASSVDSTTAFGANLLGAMVGGCLEYLALLVGYPGLLGIAGILYAGAFTLLPGTRPER
ncbi:MAG: spermidine synthase [Gaiellaceae bacterium]